MWGALDLSVPTMWDTLDRVLPTAAKSKVLKVEAVSQKDGARRFDLWVEDQANMQYILSVLRSNSRRLGWHVRQHIPNPRDRPRYRNVSTKQQDEAVAPPSLLDASGTSLCSSSLLEQSPPPPDSSSPCRLNMASWNVRSLCDADKRATIVHMAQVCRVSVLALQETWWSPRSWRLRLPGANCIAYPRQPDTPGALGVALAVFRPHRLQLVGQPHPNFVFGKVSLLQHHHSRRGTAPRRQTQEKGRLGERGSGSAPAEAWVVGSIYVPPRSAGKRRTEVLHLLLSQLKALLRQFPSTPLVVLGDWNMREQELAKLLARWHLPLARASVCGNPATTHTPRLRPRSAIDHAVYRTDIMRTHHQLRCRVDRSWDLSDHWPLLVRCLYHNLHQQEHAPSPSSSSSSSYSKGTCSDIEQGWVRVGRMRPLRLLSEDSKQELVHHNFWNPLRALMDQEEDSDLDVDDAAKRLVSTIQRVAQECHILKDAGERPPAGKSHTSAASSTGRAAHLSHRTRSLIARKRALFLKLQRIPHGSERWERTMREYLSTRHAAKTAVRKENRVSWLKYVQRGCMAVRGDCKRHWQWIRSLIRSSSSSSCTLPDSHQAGFSSCSSSVIDISRQPIKHPHSKEVLTDPLEIAQAWNLYFGELAEDRTGHQSDTAHWERVGSSIPSLPPLEGLNRPLQWKEVRAALLSMKNGKAPGCDGVSADFLKLCCGQSLEEEDDDGDDAETHPPNPMAAVLFKLLCAMWAQETVPSVWNMAEVVPIFKNRGDQLEMENYRGISLIPVVLKLLCTIITRRLASMIDDQINPRLHKEQAGFRSREECLGHIVALYEVLRRRQIMQLPSYLAFIDLKKAYDTVPHGALFHKLEKIGVRGKCLRFIQNLYRHSSVSFRAPSDCCRNISPAPLRRGLRQGCPMSPLLFNVFINDIIDEIRELGVHVPGLPRSTTLGGLLFADDLVLLSDHPDKLQQSLDAITHWADKWEMQFGVSKCAIMGIDMPISHLSSLREDQWTLQGQPVPLVEEYVYLGTLLHNSLDMKESIRYRVGRAKKALQSVSPFLSCRSIPLHIRSRVFMSMVCPVALYGAELWGLREDRTRPIHSLFANAIQRIAGTYTGTLARELRIPPVAALAAARRTRAFFKFPSLKTWVSTLCQHPLRKRKKTWLTGCQYWLRRFRIPDVGPDSSPSQAATQICQWIWERDRAKDHSHAWDWFHSCHFEHTSSMLFNLASLHIQWTPGFNAMIQMRTRSFLTARKLSIIGKLPSLYMTLCPFCRNEHAQGESIPHLLVECAAWEKWRRIYLQDLIQSCRRTLMNCTRNQGSSSRRDGTAVGADGVSILRSSSAALSPPCSEGIACLLLGGEWNGVRLREWGGNAPNHESPTHQEIELEVELSFSPSPTPDNPYLSKKGCGATLVAQFLQRTLRARNRWIWALRKEYSASSTLCSSSSSTGQSLENG
ncbi:MAG: hypothetical protein D6698_06070 [Gammaproteobacteria bacterium]|nr:MAG: hypothetical protein D6698_06070 [Gammaproteobacteria bacterium]